MLRTPPLLKDLNLNLQNDVKISKYAVLHLVINLTNNISVNRYLPHKNNELLFLMTLTNLDCSL